MRSFGASGLQEWLNREILERLWQTLEGPVHK